MLLIKSSPSIVKIESATSAELSQVKKLLTYKDKGADYEYQRLLKNEWLRKKLGAGFDTQLAKLQSRIVNCLVTFQDGWVVPSGLVGKILTAFPDALYENRVAYPKPGLIPWATKPPKLRHYQDEAVKALVEARHGAISVPTGGGKSLIILNVIKALGLKSLIVAPSISIAEQLYDDFVLYFGKKYVGKFFASKKESKKLFVIGVAQSVVRVVEGSEHWDNLAQTQVFAFDESHMAPAETLKKVGFGVAANAPYRFFTSATQMRGDGKDLLLEGIIGDIAYEYSVEQGVKDGFLSPMEFKVIEMESSVNDYSSDPNENTRAHLFYNQAVLKKAAQCANQAVLGGRKVLILIDEIEQFTQLFQNILHPFRFAHGGNMSQSQKDRIPKDHHTSDPNKLVEEFNEGKYPILVGTSCVSMGTDTKAVDYIVYLQGGQSEVQLRQAIGRGTRIFEGKKNCIVVDFDVVNNKVTHRHAQARKAIYKEIGPIEIIDNTR
jgi:superfamily II DNA or RNA helicase